VNGTPGYSKSQEPASQNPVAMRWIIWYIDYDVSAQKMRRFRLRNEEMTLA
jgi:hypothetical protein